ncbi:DUF1003 domain-containing protein [Amycolatopsis saalfeldensis]|uniref:Uncharacterized membrane protein n=1 Tax=Amycolatopsis saalfeldensis TaxID=394193 RepID=A0A1H8YFT8_9PSEU|nr:DUF1003 domain-containing protein [Amycolatopsis saalfeldensis]SEP51019.1 Uncharacterized membrane protein [Amycolatopsis saalfeldensis]
MSNTGRRVRPRRQPVTTADERVGLNGAIAAALTRVVGSMPALYVVLVLVAGWMALATWGPLHAADPYPFAFLLFLDNVVQLVLCLVILVGQRVLGRAADRRSVQTYENAEAVFARIADLQQHLDRHDRALSRGVSLLESSPHPWIERHQVGRPAQALDQEVSVNDRIAARLTQRLGSMAAFYAAAGTQVVWMGLAALGVQRFDPYPFAFMSFLSTLAQLIFMIVIMVGQGVLGRAGDRRSEQTFFNGEAILHECGRMKARLLAQDRLIDDLSRYTRGELIEDLARAIHDADSHALRETSPGPRAGDSGPLRLRWDHLPPEHKALAQAQARQLGEQLATVGCVMVPAFDATLTITLDESEVALLARQEHERWLAERTGQPVDGPVPDLGPWDRLPEPARARRLHVARSIPGLVASVGMQVVRDGRARDGAGEADFTAPEQEVLQRAMMAAGILAALAVGGVDSDEMFTLIKTLREASVTHPRRLIRELTAACTFETGLRPGIKYADYQVPALEAIRSAAAIVARTAPAELPDFREFLVEIATVVADANQEGGFLGLGAQRRTPAETAAIDAVRKAARNED